MGQPSHKTPQRIARMLDLHKRGSSAREIAAELGVASHVTITQWLRDAGQDPNGGNGARAQRKRVEVTGPRGDLAQAQQQLAELSSQPAPKDYAEVLERMLKNFSLVAGLVEFQVAQAQAGRSTMTELQKAIAIQDSFAVKIRELTPKAPPDPDAGPDVSSAAELLVSKLMATAQTARRAARCAHCGKNPYG